MLQNIITSTKSFAATMLADIDGTVSTPGHADNSSASVTMNSLEISRLTKKEHKHVIRDINTMLSHIGDGPKMDQAHITKDSRGYISQILLSSLLTQTLVTGYSVPLRYRVLQRLNELEAEDAKPTTFEDLLLAYTEQMTKMNKKISEDAEKVRFYDEMTGTENLFNPCAAGKLFGIGRNNYLQLLRDHNVLMSRPNRINMPYQQYIDAGLFEVKLGDYRDRKTGKIEAKAHPMLTGKGVIWFEKFMNQNIQATLQLDPPDRNQFAVSGPKHHH